MGFRMSPSVCSAIDVGNNSLSGSLPSGLIRLGTVLRVLDISNNALGGTVPFSVLSALTLLQYVALGGIVSRLTPACVCTCLCV